MLKKAIFSTFFILLLLLALSHNVNAANNITYFYGEPIKIENENIKILSNEMQIDTTTSIINNTFLIENNSEENIKTDIIIPIENKELSITANSVEILLDDTAVEYTKNKNGEFVVTTIIPASYGKKIQIKYKTDNDLLKAKIIKYNMQNFGKRTIGKVKVDIVLREKDIPLVQGIYPGHFTFDYDTISVEYYNFKASAITKNVIVQKDTYYNIQYGRDYEISDYDKIVLNKIEEWLNDGIQIDYEIQSDRNNYNGLELYKKLLGIENEDVLNFDEAKFNESVCKTVLDYAIIKQIIKDRRVSIFVSDYENLPLVQYIVDSYDFKYDEEDNYLSLQDKLKGKIICIEYVETEQDKQIYVNKKIKGTEEENATELVLAKEREVLRTKISGNHSVGHLGAKIIYIGQGMDGEDLGATEDEVLDYINSINADLYIRIELYSGKAEYEEFNYTDENGNTLVSKVYKKGKIGYYNSKDNEMARAFALQENQKSLLSEGFFFATWNKELQEKYKTYDNYTNNFYEDFYNEVLVKLNNTISTRCEIPILVQFVGILVNENGKYVVHYFEDEGFYNGNDRGLITAKQVLETDRAKELLENNKTNNQNKKNDIETKISNVQLLNNEQYIQEEIKAAIEAEKEPIESNEVSQNTTLTIQDRLVIMIILFIMIIVCVIVLLVLKKKGDKGWKKVK